MNLWNEWVKLKIQEMAVSLVIAHHPVSSLDCSIYLQFFFLLVSLQILFFFSPSNSTLWLSNSQSRFLYLLLHWHLAVPWGHCILHYSLSEGSFVSDPKDESSWVLSCCHFLIVTLHLLITPQCFRRSFCFPCHSTHPPQPPGHSISSTEN